MIMAEHDHHHSDRVRDKALRILLRSKKTLALSADPGHNEVLSDISNAELQRGL